MYLYYQKSACFWKGYNRAWPFWHEPSSNWTVLTTTVSSVRDLRHQFLNIFWSLRFVLFWDFIQSRMVIPYRCSGTINRSHLQGSSSPRWMDCLTLEDGTDRLSRNVRTILRCVKSQERISLWHHSGSMRSCNFKSAYAQFTSSIQDYHNEKLCTKWSHL
jgi:hypothetical protein